MRSRFRQTIATVALAIASGVLTAGTAAAQSYITTEPAKTIVRERAPLSLTPAQRTTIYRTIVPQGRGKQPIVRERVVTETVGSGGAVRERIVTEPTVRERVVVDPITRERVVTTPTEVEYVVGDRMPNTVRLNSFPERVVREVPMTSGYRYMVVNDRVLLVDPATSTVVAEIR